jgi:heat shock protein HslJ
MRIILLNIVVLFAVFISSCTMSENSVTKAKLEGNIWNLYELNGKEYVPSVEFDPAYIEFGDDERFYGFGSCNEFFGTFKKGPKDSIKITSGMTAKYCEGQMDFEFELGDALLGTTKYKISGEELILYKDGRAVAKFFTLVIN